MHTHEVHQAEPSVTRRRFVAWIGWGSFVSFLGGIAVATARFFFPCVLYESSATFVAGKPEDYTVGEVSTRHKKDHRVRTADGLDQEIGSRGAATHRDVKRRRKGRAQRDTVPMEVGRRRYGGTTAGFIGTK